MYLAVGLKDGKISIAYISGYNERILRNWLIRDDSTDEVLMEDMPTITFTASSYYQNQGCTWNLSKIELSRKPLLDQEGQLHFQKTQRLIVKENPRFNFYRALPDGTPNLRTSRILRDCDDVTAMDCSLVYAAGLYEETPQVESWTQTHRP